MLCCNASLAEGRGTKKLINEKKQSPLFLSLIVSTLSSTTISGRSLVYLPTYLPHTQSIPTHPTFLSQQEPPRLTPPSTCPPSPPPAQPSSSSPSSPPTLKLPPLPSSPSTPPPQLPSLQQLSSEPRLDWWRRRLLIVVYHRRRRLVYLMVLIFRGCQEISSSSISSLLYGMDS